MRRLLPTALAVAVLVAAFAGVASARLANDGPAAPAAAPFRHVPAALPREDVEHEGAFGFRSSAAIAATLEGGAAPASSAAPAGGASATVTITATVLPVVTIVVDDETGEVVELVTNTTDRDAREVLYVVRDGSAAAGDTRPLDAATWAAARAALADARVGTGTIWSA